MRHSIVLAGLHGLGTIGCVYCDRMHISERGQRVQTLHTDERIPVSGVNYEPSVYSKHIRRAERSHVLYPSLSQSVLHTMPAIHAVSV